MFQTPQGTRNLRSASPSGGLKQSQFSMRNNNYNNNNNSQQIQQTNSSSSKTSKLPKLLNEEKGTNQDNLVIDVGVCSLQGRRPYQEDQFAVCRFLKDPTTQSENTPETHFFGVFDGHAGGKCSKAICTTIPYQFCRDESFLTKVPIALRKAIQRTNEQFLEVAGRMRLNDGSTAVCVVLRGLTMTISNVGDSRAVLISGKKGIPLTEDHKPSSPSEQKRIASFGGTVTYNTGIARVAGVLAVSRAFGNYSIRNLIRADPDITERELTSQDDFVVLASDGLWDVFSANEVAEVCYSWQRYGVNRIADQLVQLALTRGSMDNVTAIVVSLSKYISRMLQQQQSQFQSYNNVNVGNGNNSNGNVGNVGNNNNNNISQSQSQQRAATASSVINASLRPDSGYSRRKNEDNNNGSNGNNVGREGIDQDKEDDDNLIGDDATITEYESTIIGISSTSEMVSDNPNPARRRSQSSSAANANHHSNFHNQNQNINNSNHSNLNINLNKYSSTFSSISGKTNQNHNSNYNFEDDSPADSGVVHSGRSESIMNSGRSTSRSGTPSNDRKLTLLSTNFSQQNSNDSSTSFITPVQSKRSQYSSSSNNNNNNNNNTLSTIPLYTNNNNNNNMKKSSSSNNNNNNSLSTTLPLSTVPNINSNGMGGGIFNNNNHNNNNNNNNNNNVSNNGSSGTGTTGNLFSKTLGSSSKTPVLAFSANGVDRIHSPIISQSTRRRASRPNSSSGDRLITKSYSQG